MTERIGGFVEKLFYTIIAYTHGNIALKKFFCQCAHIPWNLIVSIGWEYTADHVYLSVPHTLKGQNLPQKGSLALVITGPP